MDKLAELPSVSLVLATWNGEAFLRPQLESLVAQTLLPAELIVIDDQSDDDTFEMVRSFAVTCPFRVKFGRQSRRVGYERNFAIAGGFASGELLMFVDQDDIWHPRKIELLAGLAAQTEAHLLVHDLELIRSEDEVLLPSFFGHLESLGLPKEVCVKGCALAMRRELIDQWGWPPKGSDVSHDCWFGLLASATNDRAFLDERLIRHRIHGGNASGWIPQTDDRVPGLAAVLAADDPGPLDFMLEMFIRSWRRDWLAPLQEALRDRASAGQREAAASAIRKMEIVDRWLLDADEGGN